MIAMWSMSISALIAALRALAWARMTAGVTIAARIAMIPITTSSSTSVKADRWAEGIPALPLRAFMEAGAVPALPLRAFMEAWAVPALPLRAFMGREGEAVPALTLRAFMEAGRIAEREEAIPAVGVPRFSAAGGVPALTLRAFIRMVSIVGLTKDR